MNRRSLLGAGLLAPLTASVTGRAPKPGAGATVRAVVYVKNANGEIARPHGEPSSFGAWIAFLDRAGSAGWSVEQVHGSCSDLPRAIVSRSSTREWGQRHADWIVHPVGPGPEVEDVFGGVIEARVEFH